MKTTSATFSMFYKKSASFHILKRASLTDVYTNVYTYQYIARAFEIFIRVFSNQAIEIVRLFF